MADNTFYATGRRKEATARVWITKGKKGIVVNGRKSLTYLQSDLLQSLIEQPLNELNLTDSFGARVTVVGGGLSGQAGAIRLGIARALVKYDEKNRSSLRRAGYMTRDPREKERKKYGRKGARRRFQFTKR